MKKAKFTLCLLCMIFLLMAKHSEAQYLENSPGPWQRIFYGGDMGLSFGRITLINISPQVGYRITNRWSAGIGGTYIYYKDNDFNFHMNIWGIQEFMSFTLIKDLSNILPFGNEIGGLLVYGELNHMFLYRSISNPPGNDRYWITSPLLGPAYQLRVGNRSYLLIMLLYNFNESAESPLTNPVFRVSLQF
ncbi:MAG: hypothetical protein KBB11_04950 [Bacteroidales bacterium]|nr:hypothetical protein [Bacteroidales bacterium]